MTTPNGTSPPHAPDAYEPPSPLEKLEEEAELAGVVVAGGLRAVEVAATPGRRAIDAAVGVIPPR